VKTDSIYDWQSTAVFDPLTCRLCLEPVWSYCHSEVGPLRVYAWTTTDPGGADDPRHGTRCYYGGTLQAFHHEPEEQGA
jgi:hypothetical protein